MVKREEKKEEDVLERMREELNKCKSKWTQLSKLTGRALSYRWIVAFAGGEIREPSFQKIVILGKYIGLKVTTAPGGHFLQFKPE